ncbi:MAG: DUF1810 domain-containing protein [Prevotellaceae bacterium]|nr:DUF1810 domain-containing protein [Prevotellaceae bacterium]MCD8304165.1 DUF1810 domain-containing protein [Prevotellaceae bacterium]
MEEFDLERFKEAQAYGYEGYETALREIRAGRKVSHWIWYIFPQLKGLGHSYYCDYYGISGLSEAEAYLKDETLGVRLREITEALLGHKGENAVDILGSIDARKVRSCMTLFDILAPADVFAEVLDAFYEGKRDRRTLDMVGKA